MRVAASGLERVSQRGGQRGGQRRGELRHPLYYHAMYRRNEKQIAKGMGMTPNTPQVAAL